MTREPQQLRRISVLLAKVKMEEVAADQKGDTSNIAVRKRRDFYSPFSDITLDQLKTRPIRRLAITRQETPARNACLDLDSMFIQTSLPERPEYAQRYKQKPIY